MNSEDTVSNTTETPPARKKPHPFRRVYLLVIILLVVLTIPALSIKNYAEILQTEPPRTRPSQAQAECGVVLTGGAGRIREGISLLSHGQIHKLIISGVHQHSTLADMFPEILFYPEIKLENVILERRSSTTAGNAQSSLPIVEALGCQSILLITSDYHMYRALKTFNQVFPGAVKIIPYRVNSDRLYLRQHVFFDTRYWGTVFEEWGKYLFYEVFVFTG